MGTSHSLRACAVSFFCLILVAGNAAAAESIDLISTLPVRAHATSADAVADRADVSAAKSGAGDVALLASAWLDGQQKDGAHASPGAFPWTPDDAAVYSNTQGATALGLVRAFQRTGEASILATAVANGDCILANCIAGMTYSDSDHRFSTHDPLFLLELSNASGNAAYAAFVQTYLWDKFAADGGNGEYGEANDLNAAEFAAVVLNSRTGQGIPDLAAWDLSRMVIAADLAGETAARDAMLPSIVASLEAADGAHNTYDVIGLAGGLWAAATIGVELDPTAGTWAPANNNADLAVALLARQAPNGGFVAGNAQAVVNAETDGQTTAFAMQALAAVDRNLYATEINAGFAYLVSLQQASGQFLPFAGASTTETGGVESHGEMLEAFAVLQLGPDRYVSKTGTDAGSCSTSTSSCLTVQYAVDQAFEGDTIHIDSGTYDQAVTVTTDGLRFAGEGAVRPTLTVGSGAANQSVLRIDGATDVSVDHIRLFVDKSFAGEGVLCTNGCTRLSVVDSRFVNSHSLPQSSSYGRTNAISAGVIGSHPVPVEITVRGNIITADGASPNPTAFRAGIALDYGFGSIGGANPGDGNDILAINHDVIVRQHQAGALRIEGNTLRGFGVQYTTPLAGAGAVDILANLFQPATPPDSPAMAGDFSAMRLISNRQGVAVNVAGNTFDGHERGVLIENFPGVTLDGNTFTPKAGSSSFSHVVLSNKELFSNASPPQPVSQSLALSATNNTFNAGTVAGTGTAIELLNDNAQGAPVGGYYGAVVFGVDGSENDFNGDFGRVFQLDNFSCAQSNTAPCPLATLYSNAIGPAANTPVVPYAGDAAAVENRFDGVEPSAMSSGQRSMLLARTQDDGGDANLGHVDYGFSGGPATVYVDDDFAGGSYGDSYAYVHSDGAANGQTVYFGIDAFATIADGIAAVDEDGTVYIADGSYGESPVIAKRLNLIGDGSTATTTINGPLTITVSGIDAMNRLLFSGFVVSNPAGDGLRFNSSVAHLQFSGVAFDGNSGHGVNFNAIGIDDIQFNGSGADCRFNNNGSMGIRTASSAVTSNIGIDNCDFSGNFAGILMFGGSGSGNGQLTAWTINNSRFIGNDATDTTVWGGGIWIKTAGAGSLIDGVLVSNSTFRDNGSSNTLNRAGLSIRARPDTTLQNIQVCDNVFEDTAAPGTQAFGIHLFDDTAAGGSYQPIEICGTNTFTDLDASISGIEQFDLRGSEPAVNVTGDPLTGWEHLDFGPMATVYVDDDFTAINGAVENFPGNPGAGCAANPSAVHGVDAFASIGEALQHVSSGGTVCVADGLYVEGDAMAGSNLVITAPVSIYGAQAGVDARNRADAGASVIVPAAANPALSYSGPEAQAVVDVSSDDVTLDGFVIDGDNTAISSGLPMGAADPDVDSGIWAFGSRIVIVNNVVRNLVYAGVEGYNYAGSHPARDGNRIQQNWIHNIDAPSSWGIGIVVLWNYYADISDNLLQDVRIGIQTNYFFKTAPVPADALIANNTIIASTVGIYHNYQTADQTQASPFTISGNQISANNNPAATGNWVGLFLQSLYDASTVTIAANSIDGSALAGSGRTRFGYIAGQIPTSLASSTSIDGGSVDHVDYGVFGTDGAFYPGPVNDLLIENIAFGDVAIAAIAVEDTDLAGAETVNNPVRLTVGTGNSFAGDVAQHGSLSGPLAHIDFAPGASLLSRMLVRAAGEGHRGALADSSGNVRMVSPGIINNAVADTAIAGSTTLAAGTFAQNVNVNRSISLLGPFAGTAGHDSSRDGTDEAAIAPSSGIALTLSASDATVDGIEFGPITASRVLSITGTSSLGGVRFINNRIVDFTATTASSGALFVAGSAGAPATVGMEISGNLFEDLLNGPPANPSTGPFAMGVKVSRNAAMQIVDNVFRRVQSNAMQLTYADGATVSGNTVDGEAVNFTNVGIQVTFGNDIDISNNTLSGRLQAFLFNRNSGNDVSFTCNRISSSSYGVRAAAFGTSGPATIPAIFDNEIQATTSIVNQFASPDQMIVGSNRYGGGAATLSGDVLAADPLPADPTNGGAFDVGACGDNTATAVVVYNSSAPQTTPVNSAFGDLSARVVDALGGAVPGASLGFAAPGSGPSATLATPSGSANYNGVWTTAATANSIAGGPYDVVASSGPHSVNFALTNDRGVTTIELVQSDFDYTNADIMLAARLVDEPGTSCGPLSPATIRDVGTYSISVGACSGASYDAPAATLTATVGPGKTVHVVETDEYFNTVADAQADPDTSDGDTIELAPGVYAGPVVLTRPITLRGGGTFTPSAAGTTPPGPLTVIDGGDAANDGVTVANGVENVIITGLEIRNFLRHCVAANSANHGLVIQENLIHDCGARGISVSGIAASGINNVTIDHNEVHTTGDRGIVIWDGIKRDITITNNWVHDLDFSISGGSGCCGIELQDGAATGVVATDNLVENTRDSGMAFIQLTSGSPSGRANVIARNIVRNTGRFGIEIKIPNGTGLDAGDGAIVVEDNVIDGNGVQSLRDRAGIAVHRRSFGVYPFQVDATAGVLVRSNTVSGFRTDTPGYEGYGIVVEGTDSAVFDNIISDNDIGLQVQQANPSYPGDSDQNAMDDWFGRGNAPVTCAAIGNNDYASGTANAIDQRSQPAIDDLIQGVHNESADTWHCTIQGAINAANDLPGDSDTIRAYPGTYVEGVLINKSVSLVGPFDGVAGSDVSRDGTGEAVIDPPQVTKSIGIRIGADNVVVDGVTVTGLYGNPQDVGLASGGNYGASGNDATIRNNRFVNLQGTGIYTNGPVNLSGWNVQDNLIDGIVGPVYSGINLWKMDGALVSDNVIRNVGYGGIQLNTNTGFDVFGNDVSNTGSSGINIGPAVNTVAVRGNLLTNVNTSGSATQAALLVYGGSNDIAVTCNTLNVGAGNALLAKPDGTFGPLGTGISIFHNAVVGAGVGVENSNSGQFVVGSNWYGGGAPATANTGSGSLQVADQLAGNPIGNAACGDNTAVAVQAHAGTPQSVVVTQAFGNALQARAVDQLGGAAPGVTINFSVPMAGASAALDSASGVSDFNGVFIVNATANMTAGGYTVSADTAPPTGTPADFSLTNLAAALDSLSIVSGDAQNGIAGLALADPLVVRAIDAFGNPIAGTPIGFTVTAGGGSIAGASAVSDASGLASSGAWTLGRNAGANSTDATVTGNPGIAAAVFTATGAEQADIAISETSIQSQVEPGETVDYLLSVTNNGPSNAQAVDILDALPVELDSATASWSCIASSGASCSTGSGSGDVSLIGNGIPMGGSISVLLSADVLESAGNGIFTNTAMADLTSGDDPESANDVSDRDVEVINAAAAIFKDGFEGTAAPPLAKFGDTTLQSLRPDWTQLSEGATPVRLLSIPDGAGDSALELLGFRSGGQQWIRLGGHDADGSYQRSQWMAMPAGELSFGWTVDRAGINYAVGADKAAVTVRLPNGEPPQVLRQAAGTGLD